MEISKTAVIGAGMMGSGIAAQLANAGVPVLLLDIVPQGTERRNVLAESAVAKMSRMNPAPFMSPNSAKLVTVGNVEDHLPQLRDCDWIIEAVVERVDIKQSLYRKLDAMRRPGAAVSSNTSTIPLKLLTQGMSSEFVHNFLITHFFNPPRYMRLLEIVTGAETNPELTQSVSQFADSRLGKSVVFCHDTPGFIANRLGAYWLQLAVSEAIAQNLKVEEADSVLGRPMGFPTTGIFGLIDLVGLDLMPHITASLRESLPASDPFHLLEQDLPLINQMIAEGYTGRKGKGGFYRITRREGDSIREAIDLQTGKYRSVENVPPGQFPRTSQDLRTLMSSGTRLGRYTWRVLGQTLAYALRLVPEAADDVRTVDEAMRLGYSWKWGPFELIDRIGPDWLATRLAEDDLPVPSLLSVAHGKSFHRIKDGSRQQLGSDGVYREVTRPPGVLLLEDIKIRSQPLLQNSSAALWDINDGVLCFEFASKANALDDQVFTLLEQTLHLIPKRGDRALIIYNEGTHFSVGANLGNVLLSASIAAWNEIEKAIVNGQRVFKMLKYAPFPVVGAPAGLALGGGCEILLHCDAIQAHAESYMGLVETGAGLIPAWGGCKEMLSRWAASVSLPKGPMPVPTKVFEIVSAASVSKSAADAKALRFLRADDGITMNRYRLLADAKARALKLAQQYTPPIFPKLKLPGKAGELAFMLAVEGHHRRGVATDHDTVVLQGLAEVLSGGLTDSTDIVTEEQLLTLERNVFLRLMTYDRTLARIEHLLTFNKPLRN